MTILTRPERGLGFSVVGSPKVNMNTTYQKFIVQPSKFCSVTRFILYICTRGFQKSNRQILLGYSFCTRQNLPQK